MTSVARFSPRRIEPRFRSVVSTSHLRGHSCHRSFLPPHASTPPRSYQPYRHGIQNAPASCTHRRIPNHARHSGKLRLQHHEHFIEREPLLFQSAPVGRRLAMMARPPAEIYLRRLLVPPDRVAVSTPRTRRAAGPVVRIMAICSSGPFRSRSTPAIPSCGPSEPHPIAPSVLVLARRRHRPPPVAPVHHLDR
jgi:hypothetical protein